ncbi:MAG: ABC transporter substrate-binding protein [Betaproteobacteria bacterium]
MGRDRRRQFLIAASALLVAPGAALAQQAQKVRRIGILSLSVSTSEQTQWAKLTFASWMRNAGYEEGRNLAIEWRYAEGDVSRLPALAEELARLNVDLIMASFNDAIAAAKRATRSIPIVMFNSINPVEQGFVESLPRPGGNITGTAWSAPEVSGKILQVLHEAAPRATRIALIGNTAMPGVHEYGAAAVQGASTMGMKTQVFPVARPEELPKVLEQVAAFKPQALDIGIDTVLAGGIRDIVAFTQKHKLPAVANVSLFTDAGGLLSYGPDLRELGERTAGYVAKILDGAKPADLPVQLPTKFELVVNLKTAKRIGLRIPQSILLRADRVIE